MPEGFKLLDAYVEVTASGHGLADKVAGDIQRESGGRLARTGSSMGGNLLGGLKGAFTSGAVGGLVGGVVGGVTSGLTSLIGAAVSDITGMLTQVGGLIATTVIDYNSTLQNATIGFETMLGSGRKAKSFLDDLQSFAKSTPFEFTDLVTSSQRLLAMGTAAKDVIPYMTGIGDAVAGLGGGPDLINQVVTAVGQMTAKGKVQGDDLMQLTEAGIPALKILADSYGVSTSKMSDMIGEGNVLAKRAVPAIISGLEKGTKSVRGFGGMMDKQSHTFSGALSNIRDGLTQTTAKAFKPFFDAASRGMQRFAKSLSGKDAEKFQKDVTKAIRPLAKGLENWFKGVDIDKIFKDGGKAVRDMFKGLKPKDITNTLDDLGDALKEVVKQGPKVGRAIKTIGSSVPAVIKQVAGLIGTISDFIDWLDQTDKASKKFSSERAKANADDFAEMDKFWNDVGAGWDGFWKDVGSTVAAGWDNVVKAFQNGGQQVTDFFGSLPDTLGRIGGQIVDGFVGGITGAWGGVTSTISDLVNAIPVGVRKLLGIASPSKVFHLIGTQVGQGLHRGLLGSVDQIKTASEKMVDAVRSGFTGSGVSSMVRYIRKDAKVLEEMAKYREKWTDRLKTDQDRLKSILSERSDFAANVKANVMGNAGPSSLFGTSMDAQRDARQSVLDANAALAPTTAAVGLLNGNLYQPSWTTSPKAAKAPKVSAHTGLLAVKKSLQGLLRDTQKFSANMATLVKRGIDPFTYDELVQAGVRGGGLETSDALLKDRKLAGSIFTLERQVGAAGQRLGNRTATHEYAGQVARARDRVAYDRQEVHNYNVAMTVTAKEIDDLGKLVRMFDHVKRVSRTKGKK